MPVDAAGPARWAGGVWRSAACASNQECLSLKGGAQPSCCSRWLRRRLQPCAGTAAVHGDATASSRRRPVRSQPDANAARERRFFWRTSTLFSRRRPPLQPFSRDNLVTGYEARPAQAARTARKKAEILPNLYCAGGTYRFLRKTPFLYTTSPALLLSLTHVTPQQARAAAAPLGVCLRRRTTARRA